MSIATWKIADNLYTFRQFFKEKVGSQCYNRSIVIKDYLIQKKNGRLHEAVTTFSFERRADP